MSDFYIIPVIDVLNSMAVHAIKGERSRYKPLDSVLFDTHNPIKIIKSLKSMGFSKIYVADLDAILKKTPNFDLFKQFGSIPSVDIMLDPGIRKKDDIYKYFQFNFFKLIIGLETIKNLKTITKILKIVQKNSVLVSIDMFQEKIKAENKDLNNSDPREIVMKLEKLGISEIILLDLFRVGQKMGGVPELFKNINKKFEGNVYIGGGVRNLNDIKEYKKLGFSGILIGTALYDGSVKYKDLLV